MKVKEDFNLGRLSWFKVGGNAKFFAKPSTTEDLVHIIKEFNNITVIGNTSNLLISDSGIDGCVVKLGSGFANIEQIGTALFKVGAACLDSTLACSMREKGISGMEFLYTIPGTIGGNVAMNAGCFGGEIFDLLQEIEIFYNGKIVVLQKNELSYSYRNVILPKGAIVLSATLHGVESNKENVQLEMEKCMKKRLDAQPQSIPTGGSTFKNPEGISAWKLIRDCNAHLLKVGGASVSQKHANFLVNSENATANNIFQLGENIKKQVFESSGIMLEWEIKRIGSFE